MKRLLSVFGVIISSALSAQSDFDSARVADAVNFDSTYHSDTIQYVEINRIIIVGNDRTRQNIITRELSLKEGDIIHIDDLDGILEMDKRRVFNLRLFNTVEFRKLPLDLNKVDLVIQVHERWYTFPIPRFQLSDRNFNEWWENYDHDIRRVTYGLRLYQYNVRGRNETLLVTALWGFQKKFRVVYRIPYLDRKQKHGLILDMDWTQSKNLAFQTFDHKLDFLKYSKLLTNSRGISLSYTFRNSFYQQHNLTYLYRDTEIADTVQTLNPNYLGEERQFQSYDALAYEFVSDRRDVAAYPLKGHYLLFHAQQNGLTLRDDLQKTEAWLSFSHYHELKNKYYLSNYTFGYLSTPNSLPYLNYGAMGYNFTIVRGYEIYVIESPQFFLNKTTFKKRIFSTQFRWEKWPIEQFRHVQLAVYFKSYADFGYAKNYPNYTLNTRLADKFLGGAGVGFDVVSSYDMVLRFEYTFTVEKTSGFFFHIKKEF